LGIRDKRAFEAIEMEYKHHQGFPEISADRKSENEALSKLGYDLTLREIAERFGISVKDAQALVRASLSKLKKH
jgi:hypothetical protein